ncbi:MAG: hypothetical protein FJ100_01620 [Deltaproteobacteria bacterium]|nr:hypothetical protein [Deltaproteobacteria bacterium]
MPFDLPRSLAKLRQRHGDPLGLRFAMLDLLFAVGSGVREQAVALPWGDALCLRSAGPPAPGDGPRLVLMVLDLELPGADGADPTGRWPAEHAHLGGPAAAAAWATALHALVGSGRQQPWELVWVRSPAMGAAEFLSALCVDLGATHLALLQSVATGTAADLDLVRVELQRPRNIWRFPTCDHTVALSGKVPFGGALPAIREVIAGLGPGAAWTLHDLKVAASDVGAVSAVLRASAPPQPTAALQLAPVTGDLRLLFPVNDALSALHGLGERLPAAWQSALAAPIAAHTAPDGLTVHAIGPQLGADIELAERTAQLSAAWSVEPLCRRWSGAARSLALANDARRPAVPAGLPAHAQVWYVPDFEDDNDAVALRRALLAAL